jgi:hypothetical protein
MRDMRWAFLGILICKWDEVVLVGCGTMKFPGTRRSSSYGPGFRLEGWL